MGSRRYGVIGRVDLSALVLQDVGHLLQKDTVLALNLSVAFYSMHTCMLIIGEHATEDISIGSKHKSSIK